MNDGGLTAATGRGLAVLLLHHCNVSGRPRGSSAFEGSADIVVRLKLRSQTISLKSVSRFAPIELSGRLDGDNARPTLVAVPDRADDRSPRLSQTDELLWQALKQAGRKGITYSELHRTPGLSRFKAMPRLQEWKAGERVGYSGTGVKGDPRRWYLTDSVR